jgi:mRNA interferase MazF
MAEFVKGDILIIPFPFSDLTGSKRRPALVLADLPGDDIILCQITSQQNRDSFAIAIESTDFVNGSLPVSSNIRPTRIFTADKNIIVRKAGTISPVTFAKVSKVLIILLT